MVRFLLDIDACRIGVARGQHLLFDAAYRVANRSVRNGCIDKSFSRLV
jgi:hypothetical protein